MNRYRAHFRFDDASLDRTADFCAENDDDAFRIAEDMHPTAWVMEIEELAPQDL